MNKKLLLAYILMCAGGFASEDPAFQKREEAWRSAAAEIRKIIFRDTPKEHLAHQVNFQKEYPQEVLLQFDTAYDRGFTKSVTSSFFVEVLDQVAALVDSRKISIPGVSVGVADFGCGNGLTTPLFCLVGAKAHGIEKYFSDHDEEELLKYIALWQKTVATPMGFTLSKRFYVGTGRDVMDLHTLRQFSNYSFDFALLGNFLHMFDPATAKKVVEQQALRILRKDGVVFASVDGIGDVPGGGNAKEAYRLAKAAGKKFPTILEARCIGTIEEKSGGTTHFQKCPHSELTFCSAETDDIGQMAIPCRTKTFKNLYYEDTKLHLVVQSMMMCLYDTALIEFVFPSSHWRIQVEGLISEARGRVTGAVEEEAHTWNIKATKK